MRPKGLRHSDLHTDVRRRHGQTKEGQQASPRQRLPVRHVALATMWLWMLAHEEGI
jgi:hypothetical protein